MEMAQKLFTDDVKMLADLIRDNWSLEFNSVPNIYFDQNSMARNNVPSSIYIYSLGVSNSRVGINYEAVKRTHRLSVDVQTPVNRQLHFDMCNEVYRILMSFRRAGKDVLGGWDYMDVTANGFKSGYSAYYQDSMDVTLTSEITIIESPGFGNIHDDICDETNTNAGSETDAQ